jgi:short-subunit dehydrogenase
MCCKQCADVSGFGLFEAYTIEQIKELFEVNFYGVVRTTRPFYRACVRQNQD